MQFVKYAAVGIGNTMTHWLVFWLFYTWVSDSQAVCNFLGFAVAVTLSFFMNAKWTFNRQATGSRFVLFTAFMGTMAVGIGLLSDFAGLGPLSTLIGFSAASLLFGYLYSRYFIFAE
jgi:putative flippase GtrA